MTLSIAMVEKTFVYGDSFSSHRFISTLCDITQQDMWYWPSVEGELVDRTKAGKSPAIMFLQATHDIVTATRPVRIIVALGVCNRVPVYTDGWYEKEQLSWQDPNTPWPDKPRETTLTDCEQYFESASLDRIDPNQLHPSLMWSQIYKGITDLAIRCAQQGHQLLVVHMNASAVDRIKKSHPLIAPLCQQAETLDCYINEWTSCRMVCKDQGILAVDADRYGTNGHHGPEGQRAFGQQVKGIAEARRLWN